MCWQLDQQGVEYLPDNEAEDKFKSIIINELEDTARSVIIELCEVMYMHGWEQASVGGILRMIGLPDERCAPHDSEYFDLTDEEFLNELEVYQAEREKLMDDAVESYNNRTIH